MLLYFAMLVALVVITIHSCKTLLGVRACVCTNLDCAKIQYVYLLLLVPNLEG